MGDVAAAAAILVGGALLVAAVGVGVGMLVARWLDRLAVDRDEEPGADDGSDA
ncbi:MAG: hypothetical protein OEV61_13050 [Chloroflexota bacterium]|jgi:F0F1-type ATP synthase membrane subunit c/vacuolar-type H+-ATPase subunit K|nr:hypothetical protein [Chloroflexota bacterium]MDH5243695.1 hypothetical protein [Chloroflexota bacterium]